MTYTRTIKIHLMPSQSGITDLRAVIYNTIGIAVAGPLASGYVEIGQGDYIWTHDFPDDLNGVVKFYSATNPGVPLYCEVINPPLPDSTLEWFVDEIAASIKQIVPMSIFDVTEKRSALIDMLWGNYPTMHPVFAATAETHADALCIDKITVSMDFGLQSIGRLYMPLTSNNRLMILHGGHGHGLTYYASQITTLLQAGYTVAVMCMPMEGENTSVSVDDPVYGQITVREHNAFSLLHPASGHPLKYFLEPVAIVLNWAATQSYDLIAMAGLSGGGWTTTWCAALDTRIRYSFPVAGSLPLGLRLGDFGDWEQFTPDVYGLVDYTDLYVMACDGGRGQLQILNEDDSCCFQAPRATYQADVAARAAAVGGEWAFLSDTTHSDHILSSWTMGQIITQINTWG